MRIGAFVLGVLAAWAPAGTALAVSHLGWIPSVGAGVSYVSFQSTESTVLPVEDVRGRESIGNLIAYDNAYLHLDVHYTLSAIQFRNLPELNYLDHQLDINLDVNRWFERHLADSRLTFTTGVRISPSLPPLQQSQLVTAPPPATTTTTDTTGTDTTSTATTDTTPTLPTDQASRENLLNLRDRTSGYSVFYGATFGDEIDPFRRYEVGGLVTDDHFNSTIVQDSTVLDLHFLYALRLISGEAGARVSHQRFIRGAGNGQVYGLSVFRTFHGRRIDWQLEPGVNYDKGNQTFGGSFRADGTFSFPRVILAGSYVTKLGVLTVGQSTVVRSHDGLISLSTARNFRFPRSVSLQGSRSNVASRAEVVVSQAIRFSFRFSGVLQYRRSNLWWEDMLTGTGQRRWSDVVAFNLHYTFL